MAAAGVIWDPLIPSPLWIYRYSVGITLNLDGHLCPRPQHLCTPRNSPPARCQTIPNTSTVIPERIPRKPGLILELIPCIPVIPSLLLRLLHIQHEKKVVLWNTECTPQVTDDEQGKRKADCQRLSMKLAYL